MSLSPVTGLGGAGLSLIAGLGGAGLEGASAAALTPDLKIMGNAATAYDPAISGIYPDLSGWVAQVFLNGISSLVGTLDPTQLTLTVTDPGFDSSGNARTVTRTITGVSSIVVQGIRRQYPNGASRNIGISGAGILVYVPLDDFIYAGSTVTAATIGATFYTGYAGSTPTTRINSSNLAYPAPKFGWVNPQQDSNFNTTSFNVEAFCFHRHADRGTAAAGRQVAAIQFVASDGTNTNTVTTTAPAKSSLITGSLGPNCEAWKATMDLTSLTDVTMCTIDAIVLPWLGTSYSVAANGEAWPTSLPMTPLRVYNDKGATYGGGYAYVKIGAGAGVASTTAATARASPYATIVAAAAGLRTLNNGRTPSHNDHGGGFIRLMDTAGVDATHLITTQIPYSGTPNCWCNVERDPLNTALVTVTSTLGFTLSQPNLFRWRNIDKLLCPAGAYPLFQSDGTARQMLCIDGGPIDCTGGTQVNTNYATLYLLNSVFSAGSPKFMNNPVPTSNIATMMGCSGTGSITPNVNSSYPHSLAGCSFPTWQVFGDSSATGDGKHGQIIYNNKASDLLLSAGGTLRYGCAVVQNQWETLNARSMNCWADGDLTTVPDHLDFHNTAVGERASRLYNDVVGSKVAPNGTLKYGCSKFSIWDNYNTKGDAFNSDAAGSVGCWAYQYNVGNLGNISLFGDVNRLSGDAPHNNNTPSPYLGNAWLATSKPNLIPTYAASQAAVFALFTNYTVAPQAAPAVGGTYTPISGANTLKSMVPTGRAILAFDIAGTARLNNGTGAAGAYEGIP